jgi:PST family polysaccharide transporter
LVLPVLARVRADEARYSRIYRLALQAPLLAISPGLVAVMAAPEPVCLLLLGREWIVAAPILAWLSLAASLQLITNSLNPLLISQDRTRELTALNGASVLVAYAAYAVGLRYGAIGVAAAYAISELLRAPVAVWWATRKGAVGTFDVARTVMPFVASAILTLSIMSWLKRELPAGPLPFLALSICIAYAATGISLLCSRAGRECLREAIRIVTKVVGPSIGSTVGGWLRNHTASVR